MSDRTNNAYRWKAITKSDTAWIEPRPDAVFVGGAGDVVAEGDDGNTETFAANGGTVLNIQPRRIKNASTATGMIALYNT